MGAVTTATVSNDIQIVWTAPTSDGSEAIDYYQVQIYDPSSSAFVNNPTYCL